MKEVELERQLKVLANRRRLTILNLLRKRKEANVSDISDSIRLSLTSTSKHLNMLERTGLVEKEQRSLNVYYRIAPNVPGHISHLLGML
ncbi:MAG: metalloregulator ArsR/SmtB family transcription factor [Candidatus Kaiserbacteria bacterium]|nr:metalloregulator ArsR/SmtB family transcription factor [Candidatus Kaiserbacteria bacterium]